MQDEYGGHLTHSSGDGDGCGRAVARDDGARLLGDDAVRIALCSLCDDKVVLVGNIDTPDATIACSIVLDTGDAALTRHGRGADVVLTGVAPRHLPGVGGERDRRWVCFCAT